LTIEPASQVAQFLEGRALFSDVMTRVTLARSEGPIRVVSPNVPSGVALHACRPRAGLLSSELTHKGVPVLGMVEHLFGALAGLGIYQGVVITSTGVALPLLDGGAAAWTRALTDLGCPASVSDGSRLRVTRDVTYADNGSTYRFAPAETCSVRVELATDDPRLEPTARFDGDPAVFLARTAPARTFAWARDLDAYLARGATVQVDPSAVVIVGETIQSTGRPFTADEPAQHKLLDLLGDLYAYGGPPRGELQAYAPGHAKTHAVVSRALADGVLVAA
jgi:UDP-3-O-[3-hydroxymyristoyl] N-acetylglucosamine deacetylase